MLRNILVTAACAFGLISGAVAFGKKQGVEFTRKLTKPAQIQQALNRLTFGARPGDADEVRRLGLKKWLDRELHPERIAENPVLQQKLAFMDSLRMTSSELVRSYPTPQMVND